MLGQGYVMKYLPGHKYDPDHLASMKSPDRLRAVEDARHDLDATVKDILKNYREDPGVDEKLLRDIRAIFVEDMRDEVGKTL